MFICICWEMLSMVHCLSSWTARELPAAVAEWVPHGFGRLHISRGSQSVQNLERSHTQGTGDRTVMVHSPPSLEQLPLEVVSHSPFLTKDFSVTCSCTAGSLQRCQTADTGPFRQWPIPVRCGRGRGRRLGRVQLQSSILWPSQFGPQPCCADGQHQFCRHVLALPGPGRRGWAPIQDFVLRQFWWLSGFVQAATVCDIAKFRHPASKVTSPSLASWEWWFTGRWEPGTHATWFAKAAPLVAAPGLP